MRKLFVEKIAPFLKITQEEHKHLATVLRAKAGDSITVCCGDGYDYCYKIDSITKNETILAQQSKAKNISEPKIQLTLFSAICKSDKNETIARTCTELGVSFIQPFTSEFTQTKKESYKHERIQKIAHEAAKQSGRGKVPKIYEPIAFIDIIKQLQNQFDLVVFAFESAKENGIKSYLRNKFTNSKEIQTVAAVIGSEGGFSKEEASALENIGAVPLSLGKRILRADTACTVVIAAILYEAGEMV